MGHGVFVTIIMVGVCVDDAVGFTLGIGAIVGIEFGASGAIKIV